MTTTQLIVSATIATAWLALIVVGVLSSTWMARKQQAKQKRKPIHKKTFDYSGLQMSLWPITGADSSGLGFIFVREVRNAFRKTLGAEQALEIQDALVYAAKFAQRQHWTSAEDKKRWAVVRDAAEAATAVIRQSDAVAQANGRISSVDVTSDL